MQSLIFDHFYTAGDTQLHSTSKTAFRGGGLGLGLAICRSLIHCHNGTITYSKNDAGGADFVIWLPQEPEE